MMFAKQNACPTLARHRRSETQKLTTQQVNPRTPTMNDKTGPCQGRPYGGITSYIVCTLLLSSRVNTDSKREFRGPVVKKYCSILKGASYQECCAAPKAPSSLMILTVWLLLV